jgi:hypothetical protein
MVRHMIGRDAARNALGSRHWLPARKSVPSRPPARRCCRVWRYVNALARLTGSLGMLLQAVVRRRANKALESLLACVQPWRDRGGKILRVGRSLLLYSPAGALRFFLLSLFVGKAARLRPSGEFSDPAMLARDAAIYACAFAFYGATAVVLGRWPVTALRHKIWRDQCLFAAGRIFVAWGLPATQQLAMATYVPLSHRSFCW